MADKEALVRHDIECISHPLFIEMDELILSKSSGSLEWVEQSRFVNFLGFKWKYKTYIELCLFPGGSNMKKLEKKVQKDGVNHESLPYLFFH